MDLNLCMYCLGCNRLELDDFRGTSKCKSFVNATTKVFSKIVPLESGYLITKENQIKIREIKEKKKK